MYKILVSDSMSEEGLKLLRKEKELSVDVKTKLSPAELKSQINDYDALLVRSSTKVTKELIEAGKKLKVIGRAGVGLDNVDVEAASKRGIIVMNTPSGNTISTAEHTMTMLLALSRNIPQADASVKGGAWERSKYIGVELYGKVLGIIGMGRIGAEVARRASSFGMRIVAYDPYISIEKAKELEVELLDLNALFEAADYITVHVPLTEETHHMISKDEIKLMKKGVRLINCARGGIIEECAVADAIRQGRVAGAAFDVFEEEPPLKCSLVGLDKVLLTPHLGASTEEAQVNVAIEIAEQVRDCLLGRGIRNAVNAPSVEPEVLKAIEPYIKLAEKLGALLAQWVGGHISRVNVNYVGDVTRHEIGPVTIALIKGMLSPILGETVNYVNAMVIAKERGIKITESKSQDVEEFANLIDVEVSTNKGQRQAAGTLFTKKEARIVKLDNFYVDAIPKGYMLLASNIDKPGIIGEIGTLLGKNKINIASMTFGREKPGGRAITVLNVDSIVPERVLKAIKFAKNILDVRLIRL